MRTSGRSASRSGLEAVDPCVSPTCGWPPAIPWPSARLLPAQADLETENSTSAGSSVFGCPWAGAFRARHTANRASRRRKTRVPQCHPYFVQGRSDRSHCRRRRWHDSGGRRRLGRCGERCDDHRRHRRRCGGCPRRLRLVSVAERQAERVGAPLSRSRRWNSDQSAARSCMGVRRGASTAPCFRPRGARDLARRAPLHDGVVERGRRCGALGGLDLRSERPALPWDPGGISEIASASPANLGCLIENDGCLHRAMVQQLAQLSPLERRGKYLARGRNIQFNGDPP